jgi:RND family efflux transporter MFP subunit
MRSLMQKREGVGTVVPSRFSLERGKEVASTLFAGSEVARKVPREEHPSLMAKCVSHREVTLVFALVVVVACVPGCQSKKTEPAEASANGAAAEVAPVPVSVAKVELRAVQRRVSVVGTLHGFERITVTPKIEGRIQATHFDVGDRVAPNTTLLELDPTDYELAVDESQRALEQELSRLDLKKVPVGEFDIEHLPSVEHARLLFENAKRRFERHKMLLATSAASKETFEQAETDLNVAAAALRQARLDVRTTLATVRHRESVLSLVRQKLSETQVKAPDLKGMVRSEKRGKFVVSKRMVSVGEMVRAFPSTPVYELVMDDILKLHVMVPERYMSQVQVGLKVEVRVEAYPKELFPGTVARINPTVDPQSRSFDVEAHVPNADHRLKQGGFAKADVIVGTADDALTIPLEAVTRFAGVSKLFRVRDGKAEEVVIEIGAQGPGWVEALGGLDASDVVVTSGQSHLANGAAVTVREPATKTAQRK